MQYDRNILNNLVEQSKQRKYAAKITSGARDYNQKKSGIAVGS